MLLIEYVWYQLFWVNSFSYVVCICSFKSFSFSGKSFMLFFVSFFDLKNCPLFHFQFLFRFDLLHLLALVPFLDLPVFMGLFLPFDSYSLLSSVIPWVFPILPYVFFLCVFSIISKIILILKHYITIFISFVDMSFWHAFLVFWDVTLLTLFFF